MTEEATHLFMNSKEIPCGEPWRRGVKLTPYRDQVTCEACLAAVPLPEAEAQEEQEE